MALSSNGIQLNQTAFLFYTLVLLMFSLWLVSEYFISLIKMVVNASSILQHVPRGIFLQLYQNTVIGMRGNICYHFLSI